MNYLGDKRYIEIQRLIMLDLKTSFVPRSPYDWQQFNKGEAKGRATGKAEAVLAVLAARGLLVTEEQRIRLLACADDAVLSRLIALAVSTGSAAELLGQLYPANRSAGKCQRGAPFGAVRKNWQEPGDGADLIRHYWGGPVGRACGAAAEASARRANKWAV